MPPKSGSDQVIPESIIDDRASSGNLSSDVPEIFEVDQIPSETKRVYRRQIVWINVVWYIALHAAALYGFYVAIFHSMWTTLAWSYLQYLLGGLGITAGAHRLWAHRSYKAKAPLRFILTIFNCMALQNDVIEWVRDHRVHHKFSETDADPHNATRGMFFAHMGWLMVKKHPDVIKKGKQIDLSDLYNDKLLVFQRKFYYPLAIFLCFIMPTLVPMYFWGESFWTAYFTAGVFRYTWLLHCTWAINSIAHMIGNRPYDKNINPRQNITAALITLGEGWHNYHHTFPFDYRASEFPYTLNVTTAFIDCFALIGWAYDRKEVSKESIEKRKIRCGDGSGRIQNHQNDSNHHNDHSADHNGDHDHHED